jgi:hypothetical protein
MIQVSCDCCPRRDIPQSWDLPLVHFQTAQAVCEQAIQPLHARTDSARQTRDVHVELVTETDGAVSQKVAFLTRRQE